MRGANAAVLQAQQANLTAAARLTALMGNAYARLWGLPASPEARPADARFQDEAWRENPAYDMMRQTYLITAQWMTDMADAWRDIDPALHRRAAFYTRQCADALSPTNFALTNPAVVQETIRTGGANLLRGAQNFLHDVQKGRVSQVPEDSFQVGRDLAITSGKVVYRNKLIELMQYTPTTEAVRTAPMLMIPPWINKYYVMDMRPDNSMFKHMVDNGFTVFAISWKNPDQSVLDLEWEDYMTLGPLEALRVIKAITGADKVNLVGYCLGGIALQYMLAYLAAVNDTTPNTATFFATHQDFGDVGEVAAFISNPEVRLLEWLMDLGGGYLDGRNMAATFNMLRANDLLWPYVINNYLMGKEPPALDLLYWNSDATRVPKKVHSFLLRNFFLTDNSARPDTLKLKGVGIDMRRITVPTYTVATAQDHIVPWKGAFKMRQRVSGPVRFILGESGHIAGIINPPGKRAYWFNDSETTDADVWLAGATQHKGSWWPDWVAWLEERSGDLVAPPPLGNAEFPPLMDAPGAYVLEQ
jgi:polyhydroxyalkanoate synthase